MRAVKENKEYTITEPEKAFYIKKGFDIVDDSGKVVEYSKNKTISYEEYEAKEKALKEAEEKIKELEAGPTKPVEPTVDEIKALLTEKGIEFDSKAKKADLLKLLSESEEK